MSIKPTRREPPKNKASFYGTMFVAAIIGLSVTLQAMAKKHTSAKEDVKRSFLANHENLDLSNEEAQAVIVCLQAKYQGIAKQLELAFNKDGAQDVKPFLTSQEATFFPLKWDHNRAYGRGPTFVVSSDFLSKQFHLSADSLEKVQNVAQTALEKDVFKNQDKNIQTARIYYLKRLQEMRLSGGYVEFERSLYQHSAGPQKTGREP